MENSPERMAQNEFPLAGEDYETICARLRSKPTLQLLSLFEKEGGEMTAEVVAADLGVPIKQVPVIMGQAYSVVNLHFGSRYAIRSGHRGGQRVSAEQRTYRIIKFTQA